MRGKLPLGAIVGVLILALPASSSAQTTIVVNSSADPTSSGNCTLRDAIDIATGGIQPFGDSCQTTPGGSGYEITFAGSLSGGEIDLQSPLPTISVPVNLIINGPANPLYINAHGKTQVMNIDNSSATVLLENLVITGGASTGNGGGIENVGTLTIKDCTFFSDEAQSDGGAIYNDAGGTLSAMDSTFYNNVALLGSGGALYNNGELILTNDTFYADTAQDGDGGAIYNANTLAVASTTFDENGASAGGAICDSKTATVATVSNTILVGSTSGGNCAGPAIESSFGGDFADDSSCNLPAGDIVANAGVVLDGSLAQLGGPTLTIALQPNGPATDIVSFGSCTYPGSLGLNPCTGDAATEPYQLTCDERGEPRPDPEDGPDGNCDSGAYEYQAPPPTLGGAPSKPSTQLSLSPTLDIFLRRGVTQTLRVANHNDVAVPVSATVTPLTDFQIIADTCGSQIAAKSDCSVTVRFEADKVGLDTGELTVSDGAGSRAADALLIGAAL